jgi:tetratricopeptide (TPR) repeat protein
MVVPLDIIELRTCVVSTSSEGKGPTESDSNRVTRNTVALTRMERVRPLPPPLELGAILAGRYELEEILGTGGAGCVYLATDRAAKGQVAVKVLREERAIDKKWIERLAREVGVARKIRHPNVCRIHDLHHLDGYHFLTMEYADGGSLQDALAKRSAVRLKKGVIPKPRDPMGDAREICAGVAALHTAKLVHRDITPANILRSGDHLVVTDFGLAIPESEETTFHGGTPRYMAPEVVAGAQADQRSDVYQLGYLLHEVLFNKHPKWIHHDEGHRMLASPAAPDAGAVEEALAALCLECLSDNPSRRPASAVEVAEKLAEAEHALPKSWVRRKWIRLTKLARRPVVIGAAVVLSLGAGAAGAVQTLRRPTLCAGGPARVAGIWNAEQRAEARRAFAATSVPEALTIFESIDQALADHIGQWLATYKDACEATHVRGEQSSDVLDMRMACLKDDLESVEAVAGMFSSATSEVVDRAAFSVSENVRDLGRCSNLNNLRTAMPLPKDPSVRERIERIQRELAAFNVGTIGSGSADQRDAAARLAQEARNIGYCPLIARALIAKAYAEGGGYRESSNPAIVANFTEALWTAESCGDDADVAVAATDLVYAERFDAKQPELWARMSTAALKRIGGNLRIEARLAYNLGLVFQHRGDYAAGVEQYRRAVELAGSLPERIDFGINLGGLSDALKELGQYEEALATSDRAIEVLTALLGGDAYTVGAFISNRGDLLVAMRRYGEAEAAYRRSLAIWEKRLPPGNLAFSYPFAGIGKALLEQGRPTDAISWLERAAGIGAGGDRYFEASFKFDLARALCAAKRDCPRGHTFALAALATYRTSDKFEAEAARVAAWMRHSAASPSPVLSVRPSDHLAIKRRL